MSIGTKSVLYGAHCFLIHPWFVARAWWTLYGFPWDPRLWVAFFVHDLGYWGKPNMDGPEGEEHPKFGGDVMHILFGPTWGVFTKTHSRFYAQKYGLPHSPLCVADKLAVVLTPDWLYLPMVNATGEIHEYMAHADEGAEGKYRREGLSTAGQREWLASVKTYLTGWVTQEQRTWKLQR
jgi:hypothetical protein